MGISQSAEDAQAPTPGSLSYALAERFAAKCFTPLELTHFKDNFFTHATDQNGLKYWNEKTLSDFLGIPDNSEAQCPLDAGPVIFRMVSYLGAFPFQKSMAPSVLTFEAMVKVVVLLTGRYGRVLRRGGRDRVRLLFGSLADVGRMDARLSAEAKSEAQTATEAEAVKTHPGFAIDAPANDKGEEDEDRDDLTLAALESLDAIEVFKHDQRVDKTVYKAHISMDTFRRLLMLLLVIAPLKPLDDVRSYTTDLSEKHTENVRKEADSILAAFVQDEADGISYRSFFRMVSGSLPYLFHPLTPLFEHLLFSKNLDLSQKRKRAGSTASALSVSADHKEKEPELPPPAPISMVLPGAFESVILNPSLLSHLSFFVPSPSLDTGFLASDARLHPVFSTAAHGSSLTSFSHHVLTWQAPSLLVIQGTIASSQAQNDEILTLGAYLPEPWKSSSSHTSSSLPCLFQLTPKHTLLPGNPLSKSQFQPRNTQTPTAYISTITGLALGCQVSRPSRTSHSEPRKATPHGAGSLIVDSKLETAELHVSGLRQDGAFLPPVAVDASWGEDAVTTRIDVYILEIWGVVVPTASTDVR